MKATAFKRVLISVLSIVLCATLITGCSKGTPDEYYWHSYYDTMEVPIETESSDDTVSDISSNGSTDDNPTDNNPSTPQQPINTNVGLSNEKVDKFDKPTVKNTAKLMKPINAVSDSAADALRDKILNTTDNIKVTGTVYYISYRGNDNNDGLSPQNPWKSLTKLSYSNAKLRSGDAVLFERGGVYRGTVTCVNGVTYGAYGSGDKPCIYESKANAAKKTWTNEGGNIWVSPYTYTTDVGIIVFNHGQSVGDKKYSKDKLTENGDFYHGIGMVYLYMDKNPAEKFNSIEIGTNNHIFSIPKDGNNITIDNICMKYGGAMGVQGSTGSTNIFVTNCEMGWLGGSVLQGEGENSVRYGNAVEFWCACNNVKVDNCWVYQIYDSGLSHQGRGEFVAKDVTFSNNLIEYTSFGAIEYWADSQENNKMINITYSDNILRFAGYGWGEISRPSQQANLIYATGKMDQYCENFVIKNNIMDTAVNYLISCVHLSGKLPVISGNTYIQSNGDKYLGRYGTLESDVDVKHLLDNTAEATLKNIFGDQNPTVNKLK